MNNIAQKLVCSKDDCTAATTGICLLGKPSPQECEHCSHVLSDQTEESEIEKTQVLQNGRTFHAGSELGTSDILQASSGSYAHVIGMMGAYNAGKTCFLLSLYLMASRQLLSDDYLFKRSLTLQGFEDRAHRLREWRGGSLPEQLADHTSLADERRPGFLHLGLTKKGKPIDLLFSDLPGEWTTSLVNRAEAAKRWKFLERADGIIMVLDSTELMDNNRYVHATNAKHLFDRLKETLKISTDIPFVILLSKADEIQMKEPEIVTEIKQYADELDFSPKVILSSSFSRDPNIVPNGVGVVDTVNYIIDGASSNKSYVNWDDLRTNQYSSPPTSYRIFKAQRLGDLS